LVETEEKDFITSLQQTSTQQQAFKQLVQQYQERLYWHIRRMVLSHADADDVLQNTFIKIFRSIKKFKGESKLYTWMYRIATNEAAIATLPEKQQLVFNMKYFQDLKYNEMSEILETSVGALKASYHIASKKIELYLTDQ